MMGNAQTQETMGIGPTHAGASGVAQGGNGDGWHTIQVFVSSNSKDFHAEREVLVKQVMARKFK